MMRLDHVAENVHVVRGRVVSVRPDALPPDGAKEELFCVAPERPRVNPLSTQCVPRASAKRSAARSSSSALNTCRTSIAGSSPGTFGPRPRRSE